MDLSALLGCAALATDSLLLTILKEAPGIRREIPGWTRQAQTAQNVHPGGRAAARRRGKRTLRESDPPKSKEESHARARLDNCRRHRVSEEGNYIAILRLFLLRLNLQRSGFRPFSCSEPFCNPIKPNDTFRKFPVRHMKCSCVCTIEYQWICYQKLSQPLEKWQTNPRLKTPALAQPCAVIGWIVLKSFASILVIGFQI